MKMRKKKQKKSILKEKNTVNQKIKNHLIQVMKKIQI